MTTPMPSQGMVDHIEGVGSQTVKELAFGRALVTPGPLDPAIYGLMPDPEAQAARLALRIATDWAWLGRYRNANADLSGEPVEAVFLGDSITELWPLADPALFTGRIIGRGVSGQTSAQILVRLMPDAVALRPRVIHLMCGINDIAGNTGPTTPQDYKNSITAMTAVILSHGIGLILGSITPAAGFAWKPEAGDPRPRIAELNEWLKHHAVKQGAIFADYHSVLKDENDGLGLHLSRDGVHPLIPGYRQMEPVTREALARALA